MYVYRHIYHVNNVYVIDSSVLLSLLSVVSPSYDEVSLRDLTWPRAMDLLASACLPGMGITGLRTQCLF